MKQLSLIPKRKLDLEFGGSLLKGKFAFSPSDLRIKSLIYKMAARFNIKIYSEAVNWSHIHLVIRIYNRSDYTKFVKALSGAMVLKLKAPKGFFDIRPFTKIGTWGKQMKTWKNYLTKNQLQASGLANPSKSGRTSQKLRNNLSQDSPVKEKVQQPTRPNPK